MADEASKGKNLELLPCSFEFDDFVTEAGEVRISCRIMKMKDSLYVWLGEANDGKMNDLSVAMMSNYDYSPISTKIMGTNDNTNSTSLAKRLSKRCGKPVYVSFNIPVSNVTLPAVEKAINAEFDERKELFVF